MGTLAAILLTSNYQSAVTVSVIRGDQTATLIAFSGSVSVIVAGRLRSCTRCSLSRTHDIAFVTRTATGVPVSQHAILWHKDQTCYEEGDA
jgi:hypothetical protein